MRIKTKFEIPSDNDNSPTFSWFEFYGDSDTVFYSMNPEKCSSRAVKLSRGSRVVGKEN